MADLMLAQRTLVGKVCSNRVWEDDTSVGDKEGWGHLDAQGAQRRHNSQRETAQERAGR